MILIENDDGKNEVNGVAETEETVAETSIADVSVEVNVSNTSNILNVSEQSINISKPSPKNRGRGRGRGRGNWSKRGHNRI